MKTRLISALAIACIFAGAEARNAAALKADLEGMLPAGKTSIKLAWIKGGSFTEFANGASNTVVYVVSSEDGVIRRLYPATGSGRYFNVNITADGRRVIFFNGTANNMVVVNWDGSGARTANVGGLLAEYWRNPNDGTDWAIVETGGMSRVNIDQTSQRVQVGNLAAGGDGAGLSDDGTKLLYFDYNRNPARFGIATIPGLAFAAGPHGGCQGSISAGSAPVYNHNPSGHTQMCVHDVADQTKFTMYPVMETIKQSLQQKGLRGTCYGDNIEGTRFTQYPNYATTMIGNSKVNPILLRLPDMKFVYIEENLSCTFCGDMDAVFLPYTGPGTPVAPERRTLTVSNSGLKQGMPGTEAFFPDGRRMGSKLLDRSGRSGARVLVLRGSDSGNSSELRTVVLTR